MDGQGSVEAPGTDGFGQQRCPRSEVGHAWCAESFAAAGGGAEPAWAGCHGNLDMVCDAWIGSHERLAPLAILNQFGHHWFGVLSEMRFSHVGRSAKQDWIA